MPSSDPLDFTNKYNTELLPVQEKAYQSWLQDQSTKVGRDLTGDSYDYDMRGWYKANGPAELSGAHLTDQFKKPNHPTFSTFSQYHGKDGAMGGTWQKLPEGSWAFSPGKTNLENFAPQELQDYFKRVEPGNQLQLGAQAQ